MRQASPSAADSQPANGADLVPGDIVLAQAGERIDARALDGGLGFLGLLGLIGPPRPEAIAAMAECPLCYTATVGTLHRPTP